MYQVIYPVDFEINKHIKNPENIMSTYTGWLLDERDRAHLLGIFFPEYPNVRAHHVTLAMGEHALPTATAGTVVGIVDDGLGVEALVVAIEGSTQRPDGRHYHITWSIDEAMNRKSHHSNDVIAEHGWTPVWPFDIRLIPMVFNS
jgi:hypothetical protein